MRVRKPKRGHRESVHVRFYRWELDSAAWRSLSPPARCLLLELKALYNAREDS